MQRRFAAIGTLLALMLAACGTQPTSQATPAPEEAVTITFWHGQSGVLGDRLKTLITQFNSTHKIQVDASFQGSYSTGELQRKLLAAVQASATPDLAQLPGLPDVAQFNKAKALTAVQQFIDSPDGLTQSQLSDFPSAFLDDNRLEVNGKKVIVSWPMSKSLSVMYYNPDILKQAGIAGPPKTWEEFRQDLLAVKQKTKATPLEWTPELYYFWVPYLRGNGGDILTPKLDKASFNNDTGVAALQYMVDLVNTDKTGVVSKGFDWQNDFAKGGVAFTVSTSVSLQYIEQAMPATSKFQVGVASLPAGKQKVGNALFGNNLVIFNKVPQNHQRAAWLFMKWLTDTDQTVAWSLASGYMPLRTSALNSSTFKDKVKADPRLEVPLDSLKGAAGVPGSPDWSKIQTVLNDMVTKAIAQKATAKQAVADAEKQVNDILQGY